MTKKNAIELFGPSIPRKVYLACSGGVDSMFALDFLLKGGRDVTLAFFHHGTHTSEMALKSLQNVVSGWNEVYASNQISLVYESISLDKPAGKSQEEHWRDERYKFFHGLGGPVVMAHHLDDSVETWLFGAMNGTPKTIPYSNGNVIRPFLLARKEFMIKWCEKHNVPWLEDKSNLDTSYARNRIRHDIMPHALKVNPGIHKVVARKIKETGWE